MFTKNRQLFGTLAVLPLFNFIVASVLGFSINSNTPIIKLTQNYFEWFQAEIKAYKETEKLMRLRSSLFKKCGVVLDDVGNLAEDKAVQAKLTEEETNGELFYL